MPETSPKALPPIPETLAELFLIGKEQAPASTIDVCTSEDLPVAVPSTSRALAPIQQGPLLGPAKPHAPTAVVELTWDVAFTGHLGSSAGTIISHN